MKIKKLVATLASVVAVASVAIIPASANDHSDKVYDYNLPDVGYYTVINDGRAKEDATASYVYSTTAPSSGTLFSVHGYYYDQYSDINQITNCTRGDSALIYPGQKRFIAQYVHEQGYPYAFLGLAPNGDNSNPESSGLWSPDSIGSYPYAN